MLTAVLVAAIDGAEKAASARATVSGCHLNTPSSAQKNFRLLCGPCTAIFGPAAPSTMDGAVVATAGTSEAVPSKTAAAAASETTAIRLPPREARSATVTRNSRVALAGIRVPCIMWSLLDVLISLRTGRVARAVQYPGHAVAGCEGTSHRQAPQ